MKYSNSHSKTRLTENTCYINGYKGMQYDSEKCNEAVKVLSDTIKGRCKSLGYDRYKFVVQVIIGERREQGVR